MKKNNSPKKKILQGIVKKHPEGFGFVIPDDNSHPDIYIPSTLIKSAFTNDYVTVSVQNRKGEPDKFFGAIESIVKRHKEFAVGAYENIDDEGIIRKHNLTCDKPILVSNPNSIPINEQDCIKVKIVQYPDGRQDLIGEVVSNLGPITSSAKDDIKRVLSEYDISLEFPNEVLEELHQIPDDVNEKDFSDRRDLRDKNFVTIDGQTAKDFDDAIYVEKQDFGYRLFVAIADVSHYVEEGSQLDQEAFLRGNSTYLPDFCLPMLPEKLSNNLCSLNPLQTRLVMVAELDYDFQGEVITSQIYPSVIISKKRLTYEEVQKLLDEDSDFEDLEFLKYAQDLARILIKNHYKEGALNLEIEETTIVVNELGEVTDFIKEERLFSHQLIEQFMLAANKTVSAFLEKNQMPFMYRIHEDPKEDKLQHLETFAKTLGHLKELSSRKNIIEFLSEFKDHEKSSIINKLILRSLSQARYSAYNKSHYGLNFKSYTHFTSPIRRYCDLMIHRFIKKSLNNSESALDEKEIEAKSLSISEREQNSVKAERQIKDIKKARFLSQHVGKNFSGVISSITSFGIFISLKEFDIEGLVRLRDLPEHWIVDAVNLSLTAKDSGYTMKFGDEVEIQVAAANPIAGNIDFELLTHKDKPLPKPKFRKRSFDGRRSSDGRRDSKRPGRPYRRRESSDGRRRSSGRDSGSSDGRRDLSFRPRSRPQFKTNSRFKKNSSSESFEDADFKSYTTKTKSDDSGDVTYARRKDADDRFDKPFRPRGDLESRGSFRSRRNDSDSRGSFRSRSDSDRPRRSRGDSDSRGSFRSRSDSDRPRRARGDSDSRGSFRSRSDSDRPRRSRGDSDSRGSFRSRSDSDRPRRSRGDSDSRGSFRGRSNGSDSRGSFRPRGDLESRGSFRSRGDSDSRGSFRSRSDSDRPRRSRGDSDSRGSFRSRSDSDRPRRSRGDSDSRGSFRGRSNGSDSRGSFRSRSDSDRPRRSRGDSDSRGSFRGRSNGSDSRGSFRSRSDSDRPRRSRGDSDSRGSFRGRSNGSDSRGSFRGRSNGSDSRGSFRGRSNGSDSRGSFRGRSNGSDSRGRSSDSRRS